MRSDFGPSVWNQSIARRELLKGRTRNPTLAASQLLGRRAIAHTERRLKSYGRRRAYKGNPVPALVSSLVAGQLKNVFSKFEHPKNKERLAYVADVANVAAGGMGVDQVHGNPPPARLTATAARERLGKIAAGTEWPAGFDPERTMENAAAEALKTLVVSAPAPAPAPTAIESIANTLAAPGTIRTIAQVAKPRAPRRARYPSYIDRYGRQRYSTKPPGTELRLPAGATVAAGTPYSFFRGAVGAGGAATTAAQVAVAGAAGVAAYLVTQRLLQYLGGRAQAKEEAGVNAARALHDALEDYRAKFGKYPPPAERQQMKAAYQAKLVELGYDPVTFTRSRSGLEDFLESYNLGG